MSFSSHKISNSNPSSQKKKTLDRFIPHSVAKNLFNTPLQHTHQTQYEELLNQNLLTQNAPKILHFHQQQSKENFNPNMHDISNKKQHVQKTKKIPIKPYKILPANYLKDDFYLNLLDYADSGHIGVGLQAGFFIWSGCATKVTKVHEFRQQSDSICSLQFMPGSTKAALGLNKGEIILFDLGKQKMERYSGAHTGRVGSVGCSNNLICSGGRDGYVSLWDPRQQDQIYRYKAHDQEICGLKLNSSFDMVATGGNDNKLNVFSLKKMDILAEWTQHKAAVKAIAFNPSDPTIISGGGSADRKLRVFSLHSLQLLNQVDTGSQVCNLTYSPISQELLTTHGYSLNELTLWKWGPYGQIKKIDSVMGHKKRVLYLAGQKNGGKVVTGAGDEQLRLWKVFDQHEDSISQDLR